MKKLLTAVVLAFSVFTASAQVMGSNGVINTVWTGFGTPDSANQDINWYGITDTLQARVDVSQFTVEGMINWGFFTDFNGSGARHFEYTNKTPFYVVNRQWNNVSTAIDDAITDAYYVNFLWHPVKGLDLGAGTRLEWKMGPAPACSDYYWGPKAHIKQGGLKYASPDANYLTPTIPGSTDVAGFTYYPNVVTSTIRGYTNPGSIGIRYAYDPYFVVAMAIPSGTNTDDFSFNAGFKLIPVKELSLSFAYEGIGKGEGHLYAGTTINAVKNFTLNAYFAINNLGGNSNVKNGRTGFGLSGIYNVAKLPLVICPEFGMTFYENEKYTPAFYFGSGFDYSINKQFDSNLWVSCAWGSKNTDWAKSSSEEVRNWNGGFVFDIRPDLTMSLNKNHSVTLYGDYQQRISYRHKQSSAWAAGAYWQFKN